MVQDGVSSIDTAMNAEADEPVLRTERRPRDLATIQATAADPDGVRVRHDWMSFATRHGYSYNFSWLGVPIIQHPEDVNTNTNATVDHDTRLGDGVHVMPGATVAGQVVIGNEVMIGSNATILPNVRSGDRAVVGADAVVSRDFAPGVTVVGVPARPIATRDNNRCAEEKDPWFSTTSEANE